MCGLMVKMPKLFQEVYTIPILRKTWDIHRYKFIKNITFLFCNLMKHLWIVKNLTFLPEWTKIPAFTSGTYWYVQNPQEKPLKDIHFWKENLIIFHRYHQWICTKKSTQGQTCLLRLKSTPQTRTSTTSCL